MPDFPVITGRKLIKILINRGFFLKRVTGSHHILVHSDKKLTISIPVHANKTLGKGITAAIIKDAGLTTQEYISLFKK